MWDVELLVNAIATVIIVGLAMVPLVNLAVGTIVGGSIAGSAGFFIGGLLAVAVTAIQFFLLQRPSAPVAATQRLIASQRKVVSIAARRRKSAVKAARTRQMATPEQRAA